MARGCKIFYELGKIVVFFYKINFNDKPDLFKIGLVFCTL